VTGGRLSLTFDSAKPVVAVANPYDPVSAVKPCERSEGSVYHCQGSVSSAISLSLEDRNSNIDEVWDKTSSRFAEGAGLFVAPAHNLAKELEGLYDSCIEAGDWGSETGGYFVEDSTLAAHGKENDEDECSIPVVINLECKEKPHDHPAKGDTFHSVNNQENLSASNRHLIELAIACPQNTSDDVIPWDSPIACPANELTDQAMSVDSIAMICDTMKGGKKKNAQQVSISAFACHPKSTPGYRKILALSKKHLVGIQCLTFALIRLIVDAASNLYQIDV
jgi:hypothetical protein